MPSSTSSSEFRSAGKAVRKLATHILLAGLFFLAIGEIWFRMPWTTRILLYEFDPERIYRIVEGQSRGLGLGNFSVISPPMTINSDGFRNGEIDWGAPVVLALGSSEVLGPGLGDEEVWTAMLGERLSAALGRTVTVVNAGTPGYGPYHQAVTLRRYLERYPRPRLVVVRAGVADRAFPRPTPAELDAMRRHFEISRRVRRVSEFLPFLVNRIQAQAEAFGNAVALYPRVNADAATDQSPEAADLMWSSEAAHWKTIAGLAARHGIGVLFFVDGGDGAPSSARLKTLLGREFGNEEHVSVVLFGARETGLDGANDEERARRYREQFQLGYDPHSNAALHRLIADFLTPAAAAAGRWETAPAASASGLSNRR